MHYFKKKKNNKKYRTSGPALPTLYHIASCKNGNRLMEIKVEVQIHVALFIMSALWKNYEEKIKAKRDVTIR